MNRIVLRRSIRCLATKINPAEVFAQSDARAPDSRQVDKARAMIKQFRDQNKTMTPDLPGNFDVVPHEHEICTKQVDKARAMIKQFRDQNKAAQDSPADVDIGTSGQELGTNEAGKSLEV